MTGRLAAAVVVAVAVAPFLAGCADEAGASLARGDRLLAQGQLEAAIAEYRLARRQQGDDPDVLLRLAQAYASRGDIGTAARLYSTLLEQDSTYRHQVASDLVAAAREALDRGGRDRMARALQFVTPLGVKLIPRDLRIELADHYSDRQEFAQALPLYLSVLEEDPEAEAETLYRTARAYQEVGGCREALPYFQGYVSEAGEVSGEAGGAQWHYGSCLYDVAQQDWRAGQNARALERLDTLLELGTPRTLIDRAQYLRGELLLTNGRDQEALEAFREVLRLNPTRSSPLAQSAEERVRQIRYGYE